MLKFTQIRMMLKESCGGATKAPNGSREPMEKNQVGDFKCTADLLASESTWDMEVCTTNLSL